MLDNEQEQLNEAWETDGLRVLAQNWTTNQVQFTFSVTPQISPVFFAARAKGRLQHALRLAGKSTKFSRKVAVRTIGDNTTQQVETYIRNQVKKEPLADAEFRARLQPFTTHDADVDLSKPTASNSGRYWYNLHLVLVVQGRLRFADTESLGLLPQTCGRIAERKGYLLSAVSVLPDHVHLALRGNIEQSPEEIALAYLNNLAYVMKQNAVWQYGYYVGTFSEYNMNAVRSNKRNLRLTETDSLVTQGDKGLNSVRAATD